MTAVWDMKDIYDSKDKILFVNESFWDQVFLLCARAWQHWHGFLSRQRALVTRDMTRELVATWLCSRVSPPRSSEQHQPMSSLAWDVVYCDVMWCDVMIWYTVMCTPVIQCSSYKLGSAAINQRKAQGKNFLLNNMSENFPDQFFKCDTIIHIMNKLAQK